MEENNVSNLTKKGFEFYGQERYEDAIKCYDEAIRLNPSEYPEVWSDKGDALYNLKKYEDAIKCYDEAIRIDHQYEHAWVWKGTSLHRLKKEHEAIICFDEAIKIDSENIISWIGKGFATSFLKKYEESDDCWNEALRLDPQNETAISMKKYVRSDIMDKYLRSCLEILHTAEDKFSLDVLKKAMSFHKDVWINFSNKSQQQPLEHYNISTVMSACLFAACLDSNYQTPINDIIQTLNAEKEEVMEFFKLMYPEIQLKISLDDVLGKF